MQGGVMVQADADVTIPSLWLQMSAVDVVTYHNGNAFPVECRASFCSFIYDNNKTPSLSSVSPASITTTTTALTLSGSKFGTNVADVSVTLGGVTCSVTSVTNSQIDSSCTGVPAGTYIPQVGFGCLLAATCEVYPK